MVSKKIILIILVLVFFVILTLIYLFINKNSPTADISKITSSIQEHVWSSPTKTTYNAFSYGNLTGEEVTTTTTAEIAFIPHFEDVSMIESMGFNEDINLNADAPGSSTWGYVKKENGKSQIIVFSYNVTPSVTSPDQPLEFNCPCPATLSIFVSEPF